MDWSPQQKQAFKMVDEWLRDPTRQTFYLAGYAGTGKTTLAQHLADLINGLVFFAAFTGKAASVLKKKGCPEASTVHSLIYNVDDSSEHIIKGIKAEIAELELYLTRDDVKESKSEAAKVNDRITALKDRIKDVKRSSKGPRFTLNRESLLADADLLVLDECSMIDERLGTDVLSFGKKVLVLGDPAQLPPVRGAGFFTSRTPDLLLTEIHRQASDNPIIRAATAVRQRRPIPHGEWGQVAHLSRTEFGFNVGSMCADEAEKGTQILCGMNRTRRNINRRVRERLGFTTDYPSRGESLVILKNDREQGVLNGVVCRADSDAEVEEDEFNVITLDIDYEGEILSGLPFTTLPFDIYRDPSLEDEYSPGHDRHLVHADWGYALTVHKSQGSEWDRVMLVDDGFANRNQSLRWQWLYTAITRASKSILIVS